MMRNQSTMVFQLTSVLLHMLQFKMLLISFSTLVQVASWQSQILSQLSASSQFHKTTITYLGFLSIKVIISTNAWPKAAHPIVKFLKLLLLHLNGYYVTSLVCVTVYMYLMISVLLLHHWLSVSNILMHGSLYVQCLVYLLPGKKTCNPSQVMTFLGIELSSLEMMAQLPVDKLRRHSSIISDASKSRKVKLCEMQSIIGCLQFATSVIVPGKAFMRRLIDRTIGVSVPFHYVTLNEEAKKDLDMWRKFLQFHNGKTIFISHTLISGDIQLFTDASKLACSAIFDKQWFVIKFPLQWQ